MRFSKNVPAVLALTVLLACLSWTSVRAQNGAPPPASSPSDCAACHSDVYDAWRLGAHSETRTSHVLGESGKCIACHKEIPATTLSPSLSSQFPAMQGESACMTCHTTGYDPITGKWKADGVTCEACHSPMPSNHPKQMAPIHSETDMCKTCHTSERFGWESWQSSAHYQNNMVCTVCHNPHTTSLKLMSGQDTPSSLCQNCHKIESQNSQHSAHTQAGITCVSCHLGEPTGPDDFHKIPDHSFKPSLEICMKCHATEMHAGQLVLFDTSPATETPAPIPTVTAGITASARPLPPNPFHVAGLTALAGLVGGMVLSIIRRR